jgi:membrane protease YdiL (CAAX protease family)
MKVFQRILISPDEPRLRSGWRLLGFSLLATLSTILLVVPYVSIKGLTGNESPFDLSLFDQSLVSFIGLTAAVFLARRWYDRRSIASLGLASRVGKLDLLAGLLIMAVTMGVIFLVEWALGWLRLEGFAWQGNPGIWWDLVIAFVIFVMVGWYEELVFRGYILQNLAEGINIPLAILLSSVIFGLAHLGNPGASWTAVVGIFVAGYFLAYAYLRTRQLWLPIGLHIGWNFFEGPVFSFPVSGLDTVRLLETRVDGPVLITGGAFGPEAGLIVLPALALGALLIYYYTRRTSHLRGDESQS